MPDGRPAIPRQLERDVLVEAGHRCAIPTCRNVPVEIAHIEPWSKVQEHSFDNLIALCPTDHTRYDSGDIDRKAMRQYKTNLSVLNSRYSELERRYLSEMAAHDAQEGTAEAMAGGLGLLMLHLLKDGLVTAHDGGIKSVIGAFEVPTVTIYALTAKGREFIVHWLAADPLE